MNFKIKALFVCSTCLLVFLPTGMLAYLPIVIVACVVATIAIVGVSIANDNADDDYARYDADFLHDAIDAYAYVVYDMQTLIQKCVMVLAILLVAMVCRCCQR
jgi:hypothetical protein